VLHNFSKKLHDSHISESKEAASVKMLKRLLSQYDMVPAVKD